MMRKRNPNSTKSATKPATKPATKSATKSATKFATKFESDLDKLVKCGEQIAKFDYNCDTLAKAEEAKKLIRKYGQLSSSINPTSPEEKRALHTSKNKFDPIRNKVRELSNKTFKVLSKQKEKQDEALRVHEESILLAKHEADLLLESVKKAARLFIEATSPVGMEELLQSYKKQRDLFKPILVKLSSGTEDDRGYAKQIAGIISKLNEQVNIQEKNLTKQMERIKTGISVTVVKAQEIVDKLTIGQLLKFLAPQATQKEIDRIMGLPKVRELLTDAGVEQQKALILSDLPEESQAQLILTLLTEFGLVQQPENEVTLSKFIQALVKNAKELQEGKKQLLSIVSVENDKINVFHIDLRALLDNPTNLITELACRLFLNGSSKGNIALQLTSYHEAAQLQQLVGIEFQRLMSHPNLSKVNSLEQVTSLVVGFTSSQLAQVLEMPISPEALVQIEQALAGKMHQTHHTKGFNPSEIISLLKIVATMVVTQQKLTNPQAKQSFEQIQYSGTDLQTAADVSPVHAPEHPLITEEERAAEEARLKAKQELASFIAESKITFDKYLVELKNQTDELATKGDKTKSQKFNARYEKVSKVAEKLYDDLKTAGENFFNPDKPVTRDSYHNFAEKCTNSIYKAYPSFKEHRSFWNNVPNILRNIIGMILAIPVGVPSLLSGHGKGYADTFFRTPATHSVTKLTSYATKLFTLMNSISDNLKQNESKEKTKVEEQLQDSRPTVGIN